LNVNLKLQEFKSSLAYLFGSTLVTLQSDRTDYMTILHPPVVNIAFFDPFFLLHIL